MKQARIKAKRRYNDIQENRSIKKNEVYVVSLKRAEEIVKANLCDIVDIYDVKDIEVKEEKPKKKPRRKKSNKKTDAL